MDSCIACGSHKITNNGRIEGYIQESFFDVYSCTDCKTKWSSPHSVDTVVYDYIYGNKNDTPGYIRYAQYAEDVTSYWSPLSYLAKQEPAYAGVAVSLPKRGKILEVGCGLGYFTYALAKSGYDAVGIDVSKEAIEDATKQYGPYFSHEDFFNFKVAEADKFDAILMIELIEHVDDPAKYLAHAKTLLKKSGALIVTTPNRSWYPDSVLWASDLPPVHLTWFSENGMTALASSLGYSVKFAPYTKFNLLYGSVLGPVSNPELNPPFFKKDGTPLFSKFHHSKMYHLTRRYGLYKLLKRLSLIVHKLKELPVIAKEPKRLSVQNSTCMCAVLRLNS
jgi:SAM-dependent methyltransferase